MTEGLGERGGVAAGHRATAQAAAEVLRGGGNAVDAAIAGVLAACVAEPVLSSLGGGGFMMVRHAGSEVTCFDFFTQTPLVRPDMEDVDFRPIIADFGAAQQEFHIGLGSVATPGLVAGLYAAHDAFGYMPMTEIAQPATELARKGIEINAFQSYLLSVVGLIYSSTSESVAQFCRTGATDGAPELKRDGDLFHPIDFANFLEALTREGPDFFYRGEVARLIEEMPGCTVGRRDLASYAVERRVPLRTNINGSAIYLNPPPAIGGAMVCLTLALLARAGLAPEAAGSARHLDALADSMAESGRLRRESKIDVDPDAGWAAVQAALAHPPAHRGTTHISVADAKGNLAAVTVSNGEGCGHLIPGTGVMLNNMLGEEDLNAAGFFSWRPGVRLSSMMAPSLVAAPDGTWTALGSGGSNRIRSALTQVIANVALFGLALDDAVRRPRLHLERGKLSAEPGFAEEALEAAKRHADEVHVWPAPNMFFGGAHAVAERRGELVAGFGDPRRDGVFVIA